MPCNIEVINLEVVGSSKTLVKTSNITQQTNPKDQHLNFHKHENLKSHIYFST
jgi:hypothetical protein